MSLLTGTRGTMTQDTCLMSALPCPAPGPRCPSPASTPWSTGTTAWSWSVSPASKVHRETEERVSRFKGGNQTFFVAAARGFVYNRQMLLVSSGNRNNEPSGRIITTLTPYWGLVIVRSYSADTTPGVISRPGDENQDLSNQDMHSMIRYRRHLRQST